ncbi:MAG: stage II sporulation protein M [Candidatus Bathyarchaeia archaeon]
MRKVFEEAEELLKQCVQRNGMIIKATTLALFTVIFLSILLTVIVFSLLPWFSDWFRSMAQSERGYIVIPPPFTENLYYYILLNNIGHFWNPLRMLVWVPFLGALILGLELLFNGGIIGIVATIAGMTQGALYPIVGLIPHGIIEIPAFILQFSSFIRWHATTIDAVMMRVTGEKVDRVKFIQGVKDTVILAIASVILFIIAAYVETYVTPHLLKGSQTV